MSAGNILYLSFFFAGAWQHNSVMGGFWRDVLEKLQPQEALELKRFLKGQ